MKKISLVIGLFTLLTSLSFSTFAKRVELKKETKKAVRSALEVNESLHGAFFKYDGKKVEEKAKALKKALALIKDKKVSKLLKYSMGKLEEIRASATKAKNYENYHIVSGALIAVIKKFDVGPGYNAYSCPMVKKNWVQNSTKMDKVHNPYASYMPHCGQKDSKY